MGLAFTAETCTHISYYPVHHTAISLVEAWSHDIDVSTADVISWFMVLYVHARPIRMQRINIKQIFNSLDIIIVKQTLNFVFSQDALNSHTPVNAISTKFTIC
jgi:hypothetical protein